jgi:S1-C subfamily serine protease
MGRALKLHFISAMLGGLIVAGGFLVSGVAGGTRTETIVEASPPPGQTSSNASAGLTAHDIYQRDAPGVVFVRARLVEHVKSPFELFHERPSDMSTGSGFVVDRRGDILTNYHLIDGADRSAGVTVQFEDSLVREATVVAVDPANDLAVLRADMRGVPVVRPLHLGDSTSVRVGDPTLTIGNPFGVDRTLTSGIVSALQHQIEAADGRTINNVIQTDQAVDAGNSGAPLLDAAGRVIGINSQLATAVSQRVAFAIPIDTADSVLSRVDRLAAVHVAYLGVTAASPAQSRSGAVVGEVARGGPAAEAGLRRGDTIQRIENMPVESISDVLAVVSTRSPGQVVALQIRRAHRLQNLPVALGSRTVASPHG